MQVLNFKAAGDAVSRLSSGKPGNYPVNPVNHN
jgi:hypothetical protein